jgi:hypothetical protein
LKKAAHSHTHTKKRSINAQKTLQRRLALYCTLLVFWSSLFFLSQQDQTKQQQQQRAETMRRGQRAPMVLFAFSSFSASENVLIQQTLGIKPSSVFLSLQRDEAGGMK